MVCHVSLSNPFITVLQSCQVLVEREVKTACSQVAPQLSSEPRDEQTRQPAPCGLMRPGRAGHINSTYISFVPELHGVPMFILFQISEGAECVFLPKALFLAEAGTECRRTAFRLAQAYPSEQAIRDCLAKQ